MVWHKGRPGRWRVADWLLLRGGGGGGSVGGQRNVCRLGPPPNRWWCSGQGCGARPASPQPPRRGPHAVQGRARCRGCGPAPQTSRCRRGMGMKEAGPHGIRRPLPQPLWQPPPTASPTACGAASEVPSLPMHRCPPPPPPPHLRRRLSLARPPSARPPVVEAITQRSPSGEASPTHTQASALAAAKLANWPRRWGKWGKWKNGGNGGERGGNGEEWGEMGGNGELREIAKNTGWGV